MSIEIVSVSLLNYLFGMISKFLSGVLDADEVDEPRKESLAKNNCRFHKVDYNIEKPVDSTTSQQRSLTTQNSIPPEKWFHSQMDPKSGRISAKELQEAFLTFQGRHFSDASCKFVVRLFDLDKNGGLDVPEFEQLYSYVKQWVTAFNSVDRGRTGFLDEAQFDYALKEMDVNFSPDFIKFLMTKTDLNSKKISLDQFIVTCVQIQKFTEEFKERDPKMTGNVTLKYEDFLEILMKST